MTVSPYPCFYDERKTGMRVDCVGYGRLHPGGRALKPSAGRGFALGRGEAPLACGNSCGSDGAG